jgi:hypothetical protein
VDRAQGAPHHDPQRYKTGDLRRHTACTGLVMLALDRTVVPALGLVAALLAVPSAGAQALPPAPPTGPALPLVQFNLQAQSNFASSAGLVSSAAFAAVGGTSSSGPAVAVHGLGQASNVTDNNMASASALWAFQIAGPANVAVPIIITGLFSGEKSNAFGVSGGVALGIDRFRLDRIATFRCLASDSTDCDSSHGDHSTSFALHQMALSGFETFINISVGGSVQGAAPGMLGEFTASLDPIISIDPTFARASEFTLYVSPDAYATVMAVPEPGTFSLLLAGLAVGTGIARRARRA